MEIQITKKEREEYGGIIISPSGSDLLPKETDIVEYTRAEKIKLGLLETEYATNQNPKFIGEITINGHKISPMSGSNYLTVYGAGTSTENATELLTVYQKLKDLPLYGSFNSGTNVPINRVVNYNAEYYKSKTSFTSTISNYTPISGQDTEYWQYLETFNLYEIDATYITESNTYWELLDESYIPTGDEYHSGNGIKTFELNEVVYNIVETYDSETDTYTNVNVYFKCVSPIILGDYLSITSNIINAINYYYSDDYNQILTYKCLKSFNYYTDTVLNSELFESLGNYYPYLAASASNRYSLIIMPGRYNTILTIDAQYFDIKSATNTYDVVLNGVIVTANNVHILGLKCITSRFELANNLSSLVVENCYCTIWDSFRVAPSYLLSQPTITSGTFINCISGGGGFGGCEIASGTFINCRAIKSSNLSLGGGESFGGKGNASGKFYYCISEGGNNFGSYTSENPVGGTGDRGDASGTFISCSSDTKSFGAYRSSGNFYNCISKGSFSFGGYSGAISSGNYYNCVGGAFCFGGHYGGNNSKFSGKAYNCVANEGSFGGSDISGTLINCIIEDSFGGIPTPLTFASVSSFYGVKRCVLKIKINGVYTSLNIGNSYLPPEGTIVSTPAGDFTYTGVGDGLFTENQVLNLYPSGTITVQQFTGKVINCVDGTNTITNK